MVYAVNGWEALDAFERVPDDYTRVTVHVTVPQLGVTLKAQTYIHVPDSSAGGLPAASYMERIRRGARAFALPPAYLQWLDSIENKNGRKRTNLSIDRRQAPNGPPR